MSEEVSQETKPSSVIQGEKGAETAQVWISAFLVVVLGAVIFAPAFSIPFHGEELVFFADSTALHRGVSFAEALPLLPGAPLTLLSYALNYGLPPSPSVALHGLTIFLHLLNGVLVFLVARALLPKTTAPFLAMSAGAVFVAFVPVAEAVCYLPLRPAVLSTAFCLLSTLALVRALRADAPHFGWLAAALVLLAMAAGASYPALCFAAVLLLLCFAKVGTKVLGSHGVVPVTIGGTVILFCAAVMAGGGGWPRFQATETFVAIGSAVVALAVAFLLRALKQPPLRTGAGIVVALLVLVSAYYTNGVVTAMADPVTWWAGKIQPVAALEDQPSDVREAQAAYRTYQARSIAAAANQLGDANARAGVLEQARPALEEALTLTPGHGERAKLLGSVLQETGHPDEAVAALEQALRAEPFDQETTLRLATLMDDRAKRGGGSDALQLAVDYYDRAGQLGPVAGDLALRAAMAHAALGDFQRALPTLQAVVGTDEEHPLSPAFKQFQAMAGALRNLHLQEQEASAQEPGGVAALLARANAAMVLSQPVKAFYLLDLVLLRDPKNAEAWGQMGVTCARMDNADGFLREWGKELDADLSAWRGLATQCAAVGLWEPALEYLKHASAVFPDAPLPLVALAEVALELGQAQRAQAMLEQAAADHPDRPEPWLKLADIAIAAKNMAPVAGWLAEAESRGAAPEAIQLRRDQAGVTPQDPQRPPRTIMR